MSRKVYISLFLLALIALSGLTTFARAEDEKDDAADDEPDDEPEDAVTDDEDGPEDEDERTEFGSHQDIETRYFFPKYTDRKLGIGEKVTLLIHVQNRGKKEFNFSHMGAHLHSPYDYSYYIQNFTVVQPHGANIKPKEQITLAYQFTPDASLEPVEFWFSSWIVYNGSENQQYVNTVYNGTVELIEERTPADVKRFFTAFLAAAGGLLVLVIYTRVNSASKTTRTKAASVETGTKEAPSVEIYKPSASSKAVSRKKNGKSPKRTAQ